MGSEDQHQLHLTYAKGRVRAGCRCGQWSSTSARAEPDLRGWERHFSPVTVEVGVTSQARDKLTANLEWRPVPALLTRKLMQRERLTFEDLCKAYPEVERLRLVTSSAEAEIAAYRAVPYWDVYLRTEHWHKTARRAKHLAGDRCQGIKADGEPCRSNGPLDAHHLPGSYAKRGQEHPADLKVLCRKCHDRIHEKERQRSSASAHWWRQKKDVTNVTSDTLSDIPF